MKLLFLPANNNLLQPTTYNLLLKCCGYNISFMKMLRHLVVVTIFSKFLSCQFFTNQIKYNKIINVL